jgi:tRNA wybutosine-synthesizing protein 4
MLFSSSDVLPWQCMTRYPDLCGGAKFVDVDFPDLMARKCRIVQDTPELSSMLSGVRHTENPLVLLQSDQYAQIGCDLRDLKSVEDALSTVTDLSNSEFMFVAEVSITYMETKAADAVIRWAGGLGQGLRSAMPSIHLDSNDAQLSSVCSNRYYPMEQTILSQKLCCAISTS